MGARIINRKKVSMHDLFPVQTGPGAGYGTRMQYSGSWGTYPVTVLEWNYEKTDRIGYDYYDKALIRTDRGNERVVPHYELRQLNSSRRRKDRRSNLGELDTPWAREYIRKARDWGEESALAGDDLNRAQFERDTKAHKYHWADYEDSREAAWSAFQEGFAEAQEGARIINRRFLNPSELERVQEKISALVDEMNLKGDTLARSRRLRELKEKRDELEGLEDVGIRFGKSEGDWWEKESRAAESRRLAALPPMRWNPDSVETLTGNLFNRIHPDWNFAELIRDRMDSGKWTEQELALTIKNHWLAGMDARYEDVLRDIRKVIGR